MNEQLLFGQYRIESTLGIGGMAVVYKAHHISLDKPFAIKKLSDTLAANPEAKMRFIREARTHAKLKHPNIVEFHDILNDEATGNVYIVMEYVEGRTLSKIIGKETGPIPFERAWILFKQILDGIAYAHSMGIVHRDLKPGNMIVTPKNQLKILDFGIARDETGHTITQSGQVVGTLQYASPEQIRGEKIDQRSDIYSLGITLYEMVAGRLPLELDTNSSSFQIMQRVVSEEFPDPRNFYPHIPEYVINVLAKATAKNINERIQSVNQFKSFFEGVNLPEEPASGSFQFVPEQPSTPPLPENRSQFSSPSSGYGTSQPSYGAPQGYGTSQPSYGAPQGYGTSQPSYGAPQGYGTSQPNYGAPHLNYAPPASFPVQVERLREISKLFPKFVLNQSQGALILENDEDGKVEFRKYLLYGIIGLFVFLFLIFLNRNEELDISIIQHIFLSLIRTAFFSVPILVTLLFNTFRKEFLIITDRGFILEKDREGQQEFLYKDMSWVNIAPGSNALEIRFTKPLIKPKRFFVNTKKELLQRIYPIMKEIAQMKKQ
ncbi:MAG: Serine/threonine-protein kinase PknD [Ignavibacteriaceae bacterium]|nr:Serine/threonine-protein kinase PknD [Ignavibacteriaceae bacterium]